jgi:hypothetical protein
LNNVSAINEESFFRQKGERLMKIRIKKNGQFLAMMIALTFLVTVGWRLEANAESLLVQAEGSQGFAAPGNREPANFLVVVTRQLTGGPVTNLDQSDFAIISHFSLPGQQCGFTNQIISFVNVGTALTKSKSDYLQVSVVVLGSEETT